ncbi:signal transduction histidine kinase [Stanieria cyanosphaera PCC 7437]|uniref:histidine kinase n=2 Tax=Stanieria cyanosphaera TaxID=102116 RepID=K9XSP8_STAC7|nr:signal transduction histidine kinase [Stanieria cyanosphaera PCC 7437]
MEKRYFHKDGQIVWILLSVSLVRDKLGQPLYFIAQIQNISKRKQAEETIAASLTEKEILLKEVHHRVKNNLQVIDSLFRHQCRHIQEPKVIQILKECQNRVSSMALLHEQLYQAKDLARIDAAKYFQSLVATLYESYKIDGTSSTLKIDVQSTFIELEIALNCGLIINELVSNSLKYAFIKDKIGYLQIKFIEDEKHNFTLIVKDNGIGLPEDFTLEKTNSLGLKLVKSFVRQLQGTIQVNNYNGTEFIILFRV